MHWIYAHLIGDYLLQNDCLAKEKKRSSWICLAHVLLYMLPFLFCGFSWWKLALIGVLALHPGQVGIYPLADADIRQRSIRRAAHGALEHYPDG